MFEETHKLWPFKIEAEDWVFVSDNTLDNQHVVSNKFARRWKGLYVILETFPNVVYMIRKLDGTQLRNLIVGKRIKFFKQRMHGLDVYMEDSGDDKATSQESEELEDLEEDNLESLAGLCYKEDSHAD